MGPRQSVRSLPQVAHVGSVFEGRFKSEPINTDEYLMTVVRYIHENPGKAGICEGLDYRWSSYPEYRCERGCADTSFVLEVFGGLKPFEAFHSAEHGDERCLEVADVPRRSLGDAETRRIADEFLGEGAIGALKGADRSTRDQGLAALKERGLSVRQIQRLTGISLGVISKAGRA